MHPVENAQYVVMTPALEALVNVCVNWIEGDVSGALVPGASLSGKTTSIEFIRDHIHEWLEHPVGVVVCEVYGNNKTIDEKKLFGDFLRSMKRPKTGKGGDDRDLFVGHLASAAAKSRLRTVVVMVDEAQQLDEGAFQLLKGVVNELRNLYKVRVVWIFFGQPELDEFDTSYINAGFPQIIGRFMCDKHTHTKIETFEDLKISVKSYDEKLRSPPKTGPSFTEHFAPDPFASGYRLENDAELIWDCFVSAKEGIGLKSSTGISMKAFMLIMNYLLQHELPKLNAGEQLTREAVDRAIIARNVLVHERQAALMDGLFAATRSHKKE